jgi:hypothetical protein
MKLLFALISFVLASSMLHAEPQHPADRGDHLVFEPAGKAHGKHIVLLSGDEEYRSEEALPMLAQLLSRHHGFKCTVLFSLNDKGQVEPRNQQSLSHPEALDSADLILMSLRFRNWDDATMQRFEGALHRGTPIVALRTSTHAFKFPKDSKWFRYSFNASKETGWHRGFGRHVLGETWVNHHGEHKVEGCRSVVEPGRGEHPILRGVGTIFAESDVYETRPLSDVEVLLRGQVTASLDPDSKPVQGKNDPMQPLAWTRLYRNAKGKTNQIFLTTMGAASDLDDAQLRRLVVNACYWVVGMEVPQSAVVDVPISYRPTFYGFNTFRKGRKPVDFVPLLDYEREAPQRLVPKKNGRIVILGAGLGSRMMKYGHFETELQLRYPEHRLTIRNIADEGNTPGFRPHPGRGFAQQFAFAGAKELVPGRIPQKLQSAGTLRDSGSVADASPGRHNPRLLRLQLRHAGPGGTRGSRTLRRRARRLYRTHAAAALRRQGRAAARDRLAHGHRSRARRLRCTRSQGTQRAPSALQQGDGRGLQATRRVLRGSLHALATPLRGDERRADPRRGPAQ